MSPQQHEYDQVRRLSTRELRVTIATNPITSWRRHYAEVELRRRENLWTGMRGWIAIAVSIVALIISLAALLTR